MKNRGYYNSEEEVQEELGILLKNFAEGYIPNKSQASFIKQVNSGNFFTLFSVFNKFKLDIMICTLYLSILTDNMYVDCRPSKKIKSIYNLVRIKTLMSLEKQLPFYDEIKTKKN
jgi:hypothetical protein